MKKSFERKANESMSLLRINPEKLEGVEEALGADGIGAFHVPEVLSQSCLQHLQNELFDPMKVAWRDNHHKSDHSRHGTLIENHTVFALKLDRGDKRWEYRVPRMRQLRDETVQFIRNLGTIFPPIVDFTPDEMSLHRYDDQETGLSWHRDNLRFRGIISVIRLEGVGEFQVLDDNKKIHTIAAKAGDLILTRATGLNGLTYNNGSLQNDCPDHQVANAQTPFITSFMLRQNSRPEENANGFDYENWKADESK